ncbi:MAG TPA: NACHT domain-containing protein [Oculatellaceae cyanobacterium]|jgi:hypothetical protein
MELGAFTLGIISNLLSSLIDDGIKSQPFFQRRKIERRIEDATAEVVEPLLPFLEHEGIPEDKQRRLIETCVEELRPLTGQPELLFQGSLNGQKIFEDLYSNRDLPQVVIEDGLKETYTLLCPRIATLLCKIPAAVKDWESEAWSENFRRFDEIVDQLRTLFNRVDELATSPLRDADALLTVVRRALAQKIRFDLDLTGLRGDSPRAGKFDDFFVHPEISENIEDDKSPVRVVEDDESFDLFTSTGNRAIIIGQPGAGKSTWAKWLQREALSTRWNGICVRVELRRFSNESLLPLHNVIREVAGQHLAEELTSDRIREWLRTKKVIFILDGFDEIRPNDRDKIYDWIVDLTTAVQQCPFIITSRPITTNHLELLSASWHSWSIEPFDQGRIIDYIQRWYSHMPLLTEGNNEVNPRSLAESWLGDPTIEPLTGNPLLLSTLLMVHHLDGSLPSGRSQLYRRYVEGMLGLWDDRRKVAATSIQLSLEEKRQIMRGFALQMFLQQKDQLDENAALELMQTLLQKLKISLSEEDVLAGLRERSGLIIGPGIYSFVHKSVLEYLVAESVLQGDQRDELGRRIDRFCLFEHRADDRWNTVTFLWAGLAPLTDVESFIDECISAKKWDLAYGILYDQYSRFPAEICRSLLLKVTYVDQSLVNYDSNTYWGYPYAANNDSELKIPTFELRSLISSRTYLHSLMSRTVQDGIVTWKDSINLVGEIRDLLWMCCAITLRNTDEWKTCLTAQCPNSATNQIWLYWVAQAVFKKVVAKKDLASLESFITAYKTACPDFCGLVPIALISVGRYLHEAEFNAENQQERDSFSNLLKVLPNSGDGEIDQELLLGTCEWENFPSFDSGEDLLIAFTERAQELVKNGLLEKNSIYERAINFINELQKYRDSIVVD